VLRSLGRGHYPAASEGVSLSVSFYHPGEDPRNGRVYNRSFRIIQRGRSGFVELGRFMAGTELVSEEVLALLRERANAADLSPVWPEQSWHALRRAGVLQWCIPAAFGGLERVGFEILSGYARLAEACLTTCFILSQREGACRRIRDHGRPELCRELLPPLARGERFATVGLSHLTTSRQHLQPALTAQTKESHFILTGAMPWVTGAAQADHIVTGAVLENGQQILIVLPRDSRGVSVGPPLDLMALAGSLTAEVHCHHVIIDRKWLLAGPAERVLTPGRAGTGGLETSCLALGLAGAAVAYLQREAQARPDLRFSAERLDQTRQDLWQQVQQLAGAGGKPEAALTLRARANALVLRATQSALTASKGTGFLRDHPAQRWARQALFFLVWSCPRPAAEATLSLLNPPDEPLCP
jgi:butyryl-CoA dehydrogenase